MLHLEYLTDQEGRQTAVVIPIDLWRKILPSDDVSADAIGEALEDYCLSRAMDEDKQTPLLNRAEALTYLED
jgi:RelB Antitoxin alpha helical domain